MFVMARFSIALTMFAGSTFAGRVRVHLGTTAVMPSAGPNNANSGRSPVHFTRFDAVEPADVGHLRTKNLVRVDRAFWRAGAAAGEKYGGGFVEARVRRRCGWLAGIRSRNSRSV
jgi:hypothetical protein